MKGQKSPLNLDFVEELRNFGRKSFTSQLEVKRGVLKKFAKFHRKTSVLESLFNKVAGLRTCNFIKKTSSQMFSCEICVIFQSIYF